ncbi:MAG: lamin tail domain-containing protein [Bacteroidales bacterium]|nr:lamin tail domain-containing protein [Bacteroidales bacterium]
MKMKNRLMIILALALIIPAAAMMVIAKSGATAVPPRPEGPCDIYADGDCPCVAAHSSTRALYASYNGPLYQVMRQSDGKTLDIGVVQPSEGDPGGYADAAAQDEFCADTYCWITTLYDQSGKGNHLVQAPRGAFIGPSMGGFNNLPLANMAPITLNDHKVYGIFIAPGMGLRLNDAKGTAVDDQAEGQYWVISGHHFNDGCCFDYGNGETDSRDDGDGTMETTYFGNASLWYYGHGPGPWIMTDQENNLVGCVNPSPNDKYCPDLPSINWRFVTATADGASGKWRMMGGDAQGSDLVVMFDGPRIINDRNSYDPMRKQGAIVLGNGGDNNNYSQGTFYEAAMTAAGTYPSEETNQKIQANIVAARYDVQRLSIAPAHATDTPPGLQTFSPGSLQNTTLTFTNTTGAPVKDLTLGISVPKSWTAVVLNTKETSKKFIEPISPGVSVDATFTVTSGSDSFNGDLVGKASWTNSNGQKQSETAAEKVRNVSPIKINEFRISDGSNSTNSFIELYNASNSDIDISSWAVIMHPHQLPMFSSIKVPTGTKLAPRSFYLLGLANSGLAVPTQKGESTIYVRSASGMSVGDEIEIGEGSNRERRKIVKIGTAVGIGSHTTEDGFGMRRHDPAPGTPTTIWQPLPEGPVITIPKGSTNVPVASVAGFEVGQKMAIGYGATYPVAMNPVEKYEVVTVTKVGKPGTQGWLSMDAKAGDTNIKVYPIGNISVGDKIRLDIDSEGHGIEWVTVTRVGTQSVRNTFRGPLTADEDPGTGLDLAEPLKFDHSSNMPFSTWGTGISFEPATTFTHSSNEPVLPLGTGITLDMPLSGNHEINAVVRNEKVKNEGYQGTPAPDQWFGGPAFSNEGGSIVLHDTKGNVVDALNYGWLVDPWVAEGYHATSGAGEGGCKAPRPVRSRGRFESPSRSEPNLSSGRFPDGIDTDSNCSDFFVQNAISTLTAAEVGSINVKVASIAGLKNGQKVIIDSGESSETAVVAIIGTTGGTTVNAAISAGETVIPVASVQGFAVGQTITLENGKNKELAIIASITAARFRFGPGGGNNPSNSITVAKPLSNAYAEGTQVSGSGITFATPLTKAHEAGTQIASNAPTPGEPNQY